MSGSPYVITQKTLAANVPFELRDDTRFVSLISASVDETTVEVSINDAGYQPLFLGVAIVELKNVQRIGIKSSTGQVVRIATGSAMVYDSRAAAGGTVNMNITQVGGAGLGQEPMATSLPVTIASDQTAVPVKGTVADGAAIGGAGNPVLIAGQDGTLVQTLKTNSTGQPEVVGAVASGSAVGTTAPVLCGGSDGTNVQRVRLDTSGRSVVVGQTAHDAAVSTDAPILNAGEARSSERAAVASADVCRLVTDLVGKLVVMPYTIPELILAGRTAAMTGTADTAVIAAQGASVRIYVTTIVVVCDHATQGTEVIIKDNATELLRVYVPALNGTAGPNTVVVTLPVPLRLSANTALNAANVTTGSNTYVAAAGYRGA